jgi:hypothetical protein
MLGIATVCVFDAEVVNNKCEWNVAPCVFPQAMGEQHRSVAVGSKKFDELVIGNFASLKALPWKAE